MREGTGKEWTNESPKMLTWVGCRPGNNHAALNEVWVPGSGRLAQRTSVGREDERKIVEEFGQGR